MKVLADGADEQLAIAAAQHDPARFADLYEKNFARVYAYVARRVSSREDAQDLTAEVFHEALRNLSHFEWRGVPFAAWLIGIAAHLLADTWRRAAELQQSPVDDLDQIGGVDGRTEERALLFELVERLPADQRLVIVRRFAEQKSIREIAAEMGRSEGAIKQLQFRALESLRAQAGSEHG